MCPCLCKCQREEVSVKSADPSVALLCVSTRMSGEPILLESVSLCVCVVSGRETMRILCYVPREAELCLHMYLLTLDPPHKYSLMKQNNSNLFG